MFGFIRRLKKTPPPVGLKQQVEIPIKNTSAVFCTFSDLPDGKEHIALVFKGHNPAHVPLVRMHSECLTGDVFGSGRCDCGEQLTESVEKMSQEGGVLLYLRQEGRGIGLYNKLDAYVQQLEGFDTYEANRNLGLPDDMRDYNVAAYMLKALKIHTIRLLSNNPDKKKQLEAHGIHVSTMCSTGVFLKDENKRYLQAKVEKTGHAIQLQAEPTC